MDEQEQIKKMQEELVQLHNQVKTQQQQIETLYHKLQRLNRSSAASGAPLFSFRTDRQQWGLENFIGLKLIHLIGIVVLVIGLSIGVKYAIDRELISEGLRIALAYAAGATLYFLSCILKKKYSAFSAILFSGAMASLYFTTYAAHVYYGLLPFGLAFAVMMALTLFTAYQALHYNRQEIVLLGLVGAYAIPFLISKNTGRAELYFTYIALINCAVVFLAYKRGWRLVNYLAQNITWLLLIGWALQQNGAHRGTGIVFTSFFFLLFTISALANVVLHKEALTDRQRQNIIINNVAVYIAAFVLFAPNFSEAEIGSVSLFFSAFTGLQTGLVYYFLPGEAYVKKMLALLSLVLFLVFVANQWDGITVTLLWLLAAVGVFSWGVAGKAVWLRLAAMVLMGVTLLKLVLFDSLRFTTIQKIVAYITLGLLLLVVGFFYQKFKERLFKNPE